MSRFLFLVIAFLALAPATLARAEVRLEPGRPSHPEPRPVSLDDLFKRLAAAKDEPEAKGIASLIERRWSKSGSDTADLLMSRAGEALHAKDNALAVELLDRVVALRPGWAEAWHRRATAFLLLDDPVSAMADVGQAIAREPRHFGAWSSLGQLYLSGNDKKRALAAFRRALAIYPHLEGLRTAVDRLSPEIDGRDL